MKENRLYPDKIIIYVQYPDLKITMVENEFSLAVKDPTRKDFQNGYNQNADKK
jgi:hypothetical protein